MANLHFVYDVLFSIVPSYCPHPVYRGKMSDFMLPLMTTMSIMKSSLKMKAGFLIPKL